MSPTFFNWLKETVQRLQMESPTFFKWWKIASFLLMLISGIPYLLTSLGIALPEPFATFSNKAVTWAAAGALFMSSLTIKTTPVAQTESGEAITKLPTEKLPFTQKSEAKEVEQTEPPPPVIPDEEITNSKT